LRQVAASPPGPRVDNDTPGDRPSPSRSPPPRFSRPRSASPACGCRDSTSTTNLIGLSARMLPPLRPLASRSSDSDVNKPAGCSCIILILPIAKPPSINQQLIVSRFADTIPPPQPALLLLLLLLLLRRLLLTRTGGDDHEPSFVVISALGRAGLRALALPRASLTHDVDAVDDVEVATAPEQALPTTLTPSMIWRWRRHPGQWKVQRRKTRRFKTRPPEVKRSPAPSYTLSTARTAEWAVTVDV
jgi:hypothetical protein